MEDFDNQHKKSLQQYAARIEREYVAFADKVSAMVKDPRVKFQKSFKFSNNKAIQEITDKYTGEFNAQLYDIISKGIESEWALANTKNDILVRETIKSAKVLELVPGLTNHNISALKAFIEFKEDGLGLSDHIWNTSKSYVDELEKHLQIGIVNGDSANTISRRIRQNLLEPEKLFRRIRDKDGNLILSQAERDYHPGQGNYKSSFKNARRLTLDKINESYRISDHNRWNNNPTVLGFEVKTSGSHLVEDMCDDLKGKYPKSFLFRKWHHQCFCYATPIMLTDAEFDDYMDSVLSDTPFDPSKSENYISETPKDFNNWIDKNKDRVTGMKRQPDFIMDNFKNGNVANGLNIQGKKR
jgi:hypothetical protein